jgi:hypothetical protein
MKAKHWVLASVILLSCVLWAWYLRGTRQLCGGYRLLWMNGAEAIIADSNNNVVTSGTVTRYATSCPLITGYTSKQGFPPETDPVAGYFLIDTDSGISTVGMTESEWVEHRRAIHWPHPSMHATHPIKLPATPSYQIL